MPKIRREYNDDLPRPNDLPAEEENRGRRGFELPCSVCGKRLFVDGETFESVNKALEQDLDNPLVCGDCEQPFVEEVFE